VVVMSLIRQIPDAAPVLFPCVIVDLDWGGRGVHPVCAVTFAAGYPVILAGCFIDVVGLKSAADDSPENLVTVKKSPAGAIEGDSPDATRARYRAGLLLDVHESGFHGLAASRVEAKARITTVATMQAKTPPSSPSGMPAAMHVPIATSHAPRKRVRIQLLAVVGFTHRI